VSIRTQGQNCHLLVQVFPFIRQKNQESPPNATPGGEVTCAQGVCLTPAPGHSHLLCTSQYLSHVSTCASYPNGRSWDIHPLGGWDSGCRVRGDINHSCRSRSPRVYDVCPFEG
jgi:hypothetical protein